MKFSVVQGVVITLIATLLAVILTFYFLGYEITSWTWGAIYGFICGSVIAAALFLLFIRRILRAFVGVVKEKSAEDSDEWWKNGESPPWDRE